MARVGHAKGPPQQGGDPVFHRRGEGAVHVGAIGEGTPEGGRIGITAAGFPEQHGRGFGHGHRADDGHLVRADREFGGR